MPKPNTRDRKRPWFYHVYNQGFKLDGKRPRAVFMDDEDRLFFLELLSRHLGRHPARDSRNRVYQLLRSLIVLVACCAMTTHFHLIVLQRHADGIAQLMNRVGATYTRYFNAKYGNDMPLFTGPACAKPIGSRAYFKWLVAYVHNNHREGLTYRFASHRAWVDPEHRPGWLEPAVGLLEFGGVAQYESYLELHDRKRQVDAELEFGGFRS